MADRGLPERPVRLVARQVSEVLLARARRWHDLVPQQRIDGVVFDVVLGAGITHLPFRDPETGIWIGVEQAGGLARPVNATAIAQSMGLPLTTVRRHAAELAATGVLVRTSAGFAIAPTILADRRLAGIVAGDATDILRTLRALAEAGYAPLAGAADAAVQQLPPGIVERVLLIFSLRVLESFTQLYGDVVTGTILSAAVAANIRHVTDDPALARRYAGEDAPPPDDLRRPIALRALARAIDLPFETVRRRAAALVAERRAVWQGEGIVVPTALLLDDGHRDNNRRILGHFEQMLQGFVSLAGGTGV